MTKVIVALALLASCASVARAGQWSFSFPAAYCQQNTINGPVGQQIAAGLAIPKFAWGFAPSPLPRELLCDVQFPYVVDSPNFNVKLTWQSVDAASSNPPVVCWGVRWEITRPGQQWAANDASLAPQGLVSAPVDAVASVDIATLVPITATDMTSAPCLLAGDPNTCAGSHGLLSIQRMATSQCANETNQIGTLTRIELLGTAP